MQIKWLGHSSFYVTSHSGSAVVTDPYKTEDVGVKYPDVSCKSVLVTHDHFDHNYIAGVKGATDIIRTSGAHTVGDLLIEGIDSYHDDKHGALRGPNVIYKITADGVTLCHMGDIGEPASDKLIAEIGKVNVLLIPVGGIYTVDAKGAKEYADRIKPDIVIPMHYFVDGYVTGFDKLNKFTDLYADSDVEYADSDVITLSPSDFSGTGKTRVIIAKKVN